MNYNLYLFSIICVCNGILFNFVQSLKQSRILGGNPDLNHDFKFQVSIQIKKKTGNYVHGCGGSIITELHILTAAHCFQNKNGTILNPYDGHVRIVAGTNRLDSDSGIYRFIDKVYLPKNYTHVHGFTLDDIAVIKLERQLNLEDPRLSIIKVSIRPYEELVNKVAIASGFGISEFQPEINDNGTVSQKPILPNIRQYLKVQLINKNDCSPYEGVICAVFNGMDFLNPHGICDGDSGGPLVYGKTLIGVVSRGSNSCDMRTKKGKFTRVLHYLDFIKRAVKDDKNKSDMFIIDPITIENVSVN